MLLLSAVEHDRKQRRLTDEVARRVRRERRPRKAAEVLAAGQVVATRDAADAVPRMVEERGLDPTAVASVSPTGLAGVASDGRPLETLVGLSTDLGRDWLEFVAVTQIADTSRAAASLSIATRPAVGGWVRMINPGACSRCAVQAGKFFRWNQGFDRHPGCLCTHVPAREADYSDPRLSGDKYFHTLDPAEQDRLFTKAGARAIRDGADLGQVVNARRGMESVRIGNRKALITREGATSRGLAGRSMRGRTRVMPETIYDAAPSRDEAIRLLKRNGFIL